MKEFFVAYAARFERQEVTSYFALSSLQMREKKTGGQFLVVELVDKTGTIKGKMWDDFESPSEQCTPGSFVKVMGTVERYPPTPKGEFEITLKKMRHADPSEVDISDFVPTTQFSVDEMWAELRGRVEAFQNVPLKQLVFAFLDDPAIATAYREAPAARMYHHAWVGGLLEHVTTLVRVCLATAPFYPEVDPDLLVTGAVLHDIGKVRELSWGTTFAYTLEGEMVGHISIALGMLQERIASLPGFPEKLRILVEHMIVSHHGRQEYGSPKVPMTPEALLLNALDDLEAKMQAVRNEFVKCERAGRSGAELTDRVSALDRRQMLNSKAYLAVSRPNP